ncbi:hypothetical protein, partial [Enterococcus casseliflavus]|uniref:hypothetical protein n=1 Tax=Enterococcus casseliflavus TaxID=37734 RepID=UPI003D1193CD
SHIAFQSMKSLRKHLHYSMGLELELTKLQSLILTTAAPMLRQRFLASILASNCNLAYPM